jgi:hypothetical protein
MSLSFLRCTLILNDVLFFNRNGVTLDGDLLTTQLGGRDLQWRVTCDLWWSRSGRRYQEWSKP